MKSLSELKQLYQKFFLKGFIISILIHTLIISGYSFIVKNNDVRNSTNERIIIVQDLTIPPSIDEDIPIIKKEIVDVKQELSSFQPIPVSKDRADEITIKTQKELDSMTIIGHSDTGQYVYKDKDIDIVIKDKEKEIYKDKEKENYQSFEVEKAPECVNLAQVKSNIKYPNTALEAGIEGKVTIQVLVDEMGNVIKTSKLTGPEVFYEVVIEKSMDLKFTPGLQNGKSVKVWVYVPFIFKLK